MSLPNLSASFKTRPAGGFLVMAAMVMVLAACAGRVSERSRGNPVVDYHAVAGDLLDGVFAAYRDFNRGDFARTIDANFSPDRNVFIADAESGFYAGRQISLAYFLDSVTKNGNVLSAVLKWQKKISDYDTGIVRNLEGEAEYTFKETNGKWYLLRVSGEDPLAAR